MSSSDSKLREQICLMAKSMFDRGLTCGSSGNISVRTESGGLIVTPTGSCFGRLDPEHLSLFDKQGRFISGHQPTKEIPLHEAFYSSRSTANAIVHLHGTCSVAMSMMPDANEDNFLPPLTPYSIMKLGKVKLLPYFMPGDPKTGDAIRGLAGKRSAVMLANHGPVVAGKDLESAVYAIEELEETAKLAMMMKGLSPKVLDESQIQRIITEFNIEWD